MSEPAAAARSRLWDLPQLAIAAVGALTLLAFALRWPYFRQSLFGDELFLYLDVHHRSLGQVLSAVHDTEKTPPLGFILAWIFARGGDATLLVRLPSFVAGVVSVPLVYLLGARTLGRAAGFAAAVWFAISPFELLYGSEARAYALVTCLVTVSTLALLNALERRELRWWAAYTLAATAAVYTHYIAALVLVPQGLWALWTHRESARQQLIAGGLVVLLWLPWLPSFVVQARHSGAEARRLASIAPFTVHSFFKVSGTALVGHPFVPLSNTPGSGPLAAIFGLLAVLLLVAVYEARQSRTWPRIESPVALLVLLAICPVVILALYSLRPHTSFYVARNLSVAVPYALVLIGWLLTRRRALAPLAVAAVALVAVGTVKALSPDKQRPDARGVAHYIDRHAPPGAAVVDVEYPFTGPPSRAVQIYLKRRYPGDGPQVWNNAVRTRTPVFVVTRRLAPLIKLFRPPAALPFHLVGSHTTRGFITYIVREFAPR